MSITSILISVGGASLSAELEHNATAEVLTKHTSQHGGSVCWTSRNTLALFYADGTEQFADIQPVGRVTSGLDAINQPGDILVSSALSSVAESAQ